MNSPIRNAKDFPLSANPGALPGLGEALLNWFQPMSFVQIAKTIVNAEVVETPTITSFMGVRQPFTPQRLMLKPEGQRSWRWQTIHTTPDVVLKPDDRIIFAGVTYRVKEKSDFTEYGYVLYEICEDYTP